MPQLNAITVKHLSIHFGKTKAVDRINFNLKAGELYALIGPNGAGKTTFIKTLVGLHAPSQGEIHLYGYNLVKQPLECKTTFGYVPDNPSGFDYLTGEEFLQLTASLRKTSAKSEIKKLQSLINNFQLKSLLPLPISGYSRGSRQKLAFLAALIGSPRLLVIDEPIVGLDPDSIKIFGEALTNYVDHGNTVFMATHILNFAEQYATQIGLMNKGRLIREVKNAPGLSLKNLYAKSNR